MKLNNVETYLMKKVFILLVINLFIFSCGKSGEEDKKLKELEYQLAKKEYELRQQENEIQNPAVKTQTAVIIDKDGWTNVRNAPNMEGAIIGRIYEDEVFEVTPDLNENWWLVKTPNGIEGYMHKSKIKISRAESQTNRISIATNEKTNSTKLPFIGTKYFEDRSISTTYIVTINSNGETIVRAGGPGVDNKGWTIYEGPFQPIMKNNEEGVKIENGFLFLLDSDGMVSEDCINMGDGETVPCKYNLETELLTK